VALKNTRLARAARYKRVDDAATDSLAEEYPFLIDEQGNPLNRNQIEAIRNIINQKLRSGTYREKVEALRAYMKLWSTRGVGKVMENMARPVRSLGTLTNGVSNFLYRNVYDAVNEMDEQYLVGAHGGKHRGHQEFQGPHRHLVRRQYQELYAANQAGGVIPERLQQGPSDAYLCTVSQPGAGAEA
jgi:hypothetical protein